MNTKSLENINTPMMKQYKQMKQEVGDKLLFFRMGDFYELFGEDAITAAPILGIALTVRDKKNSIPMCGIPYHAVNNYISKLTDKGLSVAICEQLEDPKLAKGVVKRGIVRIVTPSLSYDPETIDGADSLYLVSVLYTKNRYSYSALEYSTGRFFANTVDSLDELINRLEIVGVKELVVVRDFEIPEKLRQFLSNINFTVLDIYKRDLKKESLFNIVVDEILTPEEVQTAKVILHYVRQTQFKDSFPHINYLSRGTRNCRLAIDEFSIKNLELITELYPIINYTKTPMGARLLKRTLLEPLQNVEAIKVRYQNIERILNNNSLDKIKAELVKIPDIERLSAKILSFFYTPQTVYNLSLGVKHAIEAVLENRDIFNSLKLDFSNLYDFVSKTSSMFTETPPNNLNTYGIFKKGINSQLDSLIDLTDEVWNVLKEIEEKEKKQTGINNLKIKFNKVFGYYIELSKSNISRAPDYYIRKQTLVNAERFITPELKELEQRILEAQDQRLQFEQKLLRELVEQFKEYTKDIAYLSTLVSELDLVRSFAMLAYDRTYTKADIHSGYELIFKGLRHPVLEHYIGSDFIPNDIEFTDNNFFHIVTGPNMSGKSTIMRSVAIAIILAHMGSFVPANYAKIPLIDKVFTRVGATDYIARGQSTFMVEMIETANILRTATKKSFIIVDEIGRGTSTFDGISIAWAVAEYINKHIGAKCMFATHYHELTTLDKILTGAKNFSMSVNEDDKNLIFTRKYIQKTSRKSYGINVAKMAGLPKEVITKATAMLRQFESKGRVVVESKNQRSLFETETKVSIDSSPELKVKDAIFVELQKLEPDNLKPIDALNILYKWKKKENFNE